MSIIEKITDAIYGVKRYWKKPKEGNDVSIKEVACLVIGTGGQSTIGMLSSYTAFAISTPLMIGYFKMSSAEFFLTTIFFAIITLIKTPIIGMILDNTNSRRGKFHPFVFWCGLLSVIFFSLIPFVPESWVQMDIVSFTVPPIAIMGITSASKVSISLAVIVVLLLTTFTNIVFTLLGHVSSGIEQTITTNSQERSGIIAVKNLLGNLPNSIINVFLPLFAGAFFLVDGKQGTGMNNVMTYRVFFPIIGILGFGMLMFMYFGTKERIVVSKQYKAKVKFFDSAKVLAKNKYFWLILIFGLFSGIRGSANIYYYVCIYSLKSEVWLSICNIVINNALVPGMLFGPVLIKRFGKRKIMIMTSVTFLLATLLQLAFLKNPYMILVCIFLQNLSAGFGFITGIMTADALDWQQYKTNKRLEGFWQNYSTLLSTILGIFTAMLQPLFLSMGGVGFGEAIGDVIGSSDVQGQAVIYRQLTLVGVIGGVLCIAPMIFYNLTEAKHKEIMMALHVRAGVENYNSGVLSDDDIVNVQKALEYNASAKKNYGFLKEELAKYEETVIVNITSDHSNAVLRIKEKSLQAEEAERQKKMYSELDKLEYATEAYRMKCDKKGVVPDETSFRESYKKKHCPTLVACDTIAISDDIGECENQKDK